MLDRLGGGLAGGGWAWPSATREWIAYFAMRWWPREPRHARPTASRCVWPKWRAIPAIIGRRLLTYRLTKSLLAVFGPLGNVAARTGRGLNWHQKIEPYVPHHLGGFILFSAGAIGGAALFRAQKRRAGGDGRRGGLLQVAGAAANIALMWRYLPDRDDPNSDRRR